MSDEQLRIAILSPPWFPVPPTGYGGIEWIVSLLADGLAEAGHDVTLFASGDSQTKAKLSAVFEQAPSELIGRSLPEIRHALACYTRADEFDVINDHSGPPGGVRSAASSRRRSCTRFTGRSTASRARSTSRSRRSRRGSGLISISMNQRKPKPDLPWLANCPNALELSVYPCKPHPGDYLLFLGRMSSDKGCHRAIAVAMELELPLKIAGKKREPKESEYFAEFVEPHLGATGSSTSARSPTGHEGRAAPGRARDALPDRVGGAVRPRDDRVDGVRDAGDRDAPGRGARGDRPRPVAGSSSTTTREMPAALEQADALDPLDCRRYAEERFAPERMVDDYVDAFREAIVGSPVGQTSSLSQ